jgi:hypothetical protein
MKSVNRSAIVVWPKQAFYGWARVLELEDPDPPIDRMDETELANVYLG